jgi:hypothetical protein
MRLLRSADIAKFLTTNGVTQEERDRTVANSVNRLPGQFETSGAVLGAMMTIDVLGRPDNYYETLAPSTGRRPSLRWTRPRAARSIRKGSPGSSPAMPR